MKQWERMEEYLFENEGTSFDSRRLAIDLDVEPKAASAIIQAYLHEQAREGGGTLYVLRREGRTTNATWQAGARVKDARQLSAQSVDDIRRRMERHVLPSLHHIVEINPRARRLVDSTVAVIETSLAHLEVAFADAAP